MAATAATAETRSVRVFGSGTCAVYATLKPSLGELAVSLKTKRRPRLPVTPESAGPKSRVVISKECHGGSEIFEHVVFNQRAFLVNLKDEHAETGAG